jgi:hypothetical protein
MKKITAIIVSLLVLTSFTAQANETESKIEKKLEQRIEKLSNALNKYKAMKAAVKSDAADRETTLRKATARLKRETVAISTDLDSLDLYLEIQEIRKTDSNDLNDTKESITSIKDQIHNLKRIMIASTDNTQKVVAK